MTDMLDITPHVNLLRSLRGERIDYVLLVAEAIDNAFDANAKAILIAISDDEIVFTDDGCGITRDRLPAMFTLGEHGHMSTTALGRFGIGLKSQAVNAGNILLIVSTSVDGKVIAEVDWRDVLKGGGCNWKMPAPKWLPFVVGTPTGTTISISSLRRAPPVSIDKIRDDIARRFYPAIAAGRTITIDGTPIELLPEPALTDIVDCELSLSGERTAHVRAGMLAQPSKLHSVHVAYKHRVILPTSNVGCGETAGLTKMFARLQLGGPWHLGKFKNDLPDEDERAELEDAVGAVLRPILEKCRSQSMTARVHQMANLINEMVPPEIAPARPKKQSHDVKEGPGKRGKPGRPVSENKAEETGPARAPRLPKDRLLITFDGLDAEDGIGAFQPGRPHRVNLSPDNPDIAYWMDHRDMKLAARSLFVVAMALFERGREELPGQYAMRFEGFGLRIAKLLAKEQDDPSIQMKLPA